MLRSLLPIAVSSLAACLAPSAVADIVITLDDATWLAGDFTLYFAPGELDGTLTAISLDGVTCSAKPQVTASPRTSQRGRSPMMPWRAFLSHRRPADACRSAATWCPDRRST